VALFVSLVGMVESFSRRDVIGGVMSLGHTLLVLPGLGIGYLTAARMSRGTAGLAVLSGALAGLIIGGMVSVLVVLGSLVNLRLVFVNASPPLYRLLTFGLGTGAGIPVLLLAGVLTGSAGACIHVLPGVLRRAMLAGLAVVVLLGMFHELLSLVLGHTGVLGVLMEALFPVRGLSVPAAIVLFMLVTAGCLFWAYTGRGVRQYVERLPASSRRGLRLGALGLGIGFLLVVPRVFGVYISEVLVNVGLFVLMGLGLNIVVGFAGLLDLGYVAFFAVGAYAMGLLTSSGPLGIAQLSFWTALPLVVATAVVFGVLLGVPVLKVRGDYLAIVTLGFGEIIRILALSDFLRPYLGGAQGLLPIPRPAIGPLELAGPQELYYLVVVGCVLAIFVSLRLRDARLGRAWKAVREDEDVAQALGINLVRTKLFAFAIGAAFAGLSGAIFAAKIGSIYPHSFHLLISINALAVIIVGGMGSLPGVIIGALVLVGLPELLREFAEYRLLFYGMLLVVMMLYRPEGLWPEATRQRELHTPEPGEAATALQSAPSNAVCTGAEWPSGASDTGRRGQAVHDNDRRSPAR
jgi:branched-chain amino acid transport system permease protein